MESIDYGFYMMFAVMIGIVGILMYQNIFKSKQKRTNKTVKEDNMDTIKQSYESTIEILKEQLNLVTEESKSVKRRLAKEIGLNMERDEPKEEKQIKISSKNLEEHYEINVENALKLVESMNIPFLDNMDKSKIPALLNNPMIKNKVWDYIRENKDEMISLGAIVPKGTVQETQTEPQEEKPSDETMQLGFTQDNAKYMAWFVKIVTVKNGLI